MSKQKRLNLTGINASLVEKVVHILEGRSRSVQHRYADAISKVQHLTDHTHSEAADVVNHIRAQLANTNP